ncbi:hypothetical protein [Lysinibacillus sphaericus]|uniref:hypothetical protein n=1 Tax=Lysinibacillus sphaericus TaxID=1421 RepID=UPI003D728C64
MDEHLKGTDYYARQKAQLIEGLVDSYRTRLLEQYKQDIFIKWKEEEEDDGNLFCTEELLTRASSIIKASENEILDLFFEEANSKYINMEIQDYFNEIFEAAL